ncbi:MAG: ATP-grasp domain-containing protein, partial [Opitutales bacterium]
GSAELGLDLNRETARDHAARLKAPIFQPYVRGREFSSEVWLDRNSRAKGILLRWREHIVDGESHRTVTFRNQEWEDIVVRAAESLGLTGHVLGQVLVDKDGSPHFVEINSRLGGATPLSIACGLHSVEWFLRETAGEDLSSLSMFRAPAGKRLIRKDDAVRIEN